MDILWVSRFHATKIPLPTLLELLPRREVGLTFVLMIFQRCIIQPVSYRVLNSYIHSIFPGFMGKGKVGVRSPTLFFLLLSNNCLF